MLYGIVLVIPPEECVDGNQKLKERENGKLEGVVGKEVGNGQKIIKPLLVIVEDGGEKIKSESRRFNCGKEAD